MRGSPIRSSERSALDSFARAVRATFGDRVRELALFGSRARGEGDADSDLDVLVVIEGLTWTEGRAITDAAGDALTEFDEIISPFALSAERIAELRARERLITLEIARDAVPL